MTSEYFLGIPADRLTMADVIQAVEPSIQKQQQLRITSVNPQIALEASQYPEIVSYIEQAQFRLPDGIGIVKASAVQGGEIRERLTGFDVMLALLAEANRLQAKVFLYGARPEVVQKTKETIAQQYPHLQVVGAVDGYGSLNDAQLVQAINASGAQFLFVALGFPKQEQWLARHAKQLQVNIIEDVGGSFDVLSGTVKRAPQWIQKLHLEWLYRSLTQRGRLNRLWQIPQFMRAIYRNRKKGSH